MNLVFFNITKPEKKDFYVAKQNGLPLLYKV